MNKRRESKGKNRPQTPYINDSMLTRESWKIFQVISEFVEGYERLVHIEPAVSIFGSARIKPNNKYYKLAFEIAELLSNAGFSVVTGGAGGVMEACNKGAYQGDSFSVGLNIVLPEEILNTSFQDISLRFRHFFTRKVMFVKYASAYIILPGGYGTLDELSEILGLIQTKKTQRIPVILVHKEFWTPLIDWFHNTLLAQGMIDKKDLDLYSFAETPEEVLKILKAARKRHESV
jgi:uncharacterized protein (TIGR00730 family)